MSLRTPPITLLAALGSLSVIVFLVYYPGLSGPFLMDDFPNILLNPAVQPDNFSINNLTMAFNGNGSGPLGRKFPSLSFALDFLLHDRQFDPFWFKLTNLVIHIVNLLLVFLLTHLLLKASRPGIVEKGTNLLFLAIVITAFWALHPLQLTGVLYAVQRMVSMAALFVFAGLIFYLVGRRMLTHNRKSGWWVIASGYVVAMGLGGLCKESALLFPALVVALEISLLDWARLPESSATKLKWLLIISITIPAIVVVAYLLSHPAFLLQSYAERDFTLGQRLLTQARVVWFYLSLYAIPQTARMGLFHDDFITSTGLLHPLTTLPALLAIVAVIAWAIWKRKKSPLLIFFGCWYIAAHAMESTIFGLEMIYEHRNYVSIYAMALVFGVLTCRLINNSDNPGAMTLLLPAVLGILALTTYSRAQTWADPTVFAHFQLRNHPQSARSYNGAALVSDRLPENFVTTYDHLRMAALHSKRVVPLIDMYKRVNFLIQAPDGQEAITVANANRQAQPDPTNSTWNAPLPTKMESLLKLESEIGTEVEQRLEKAKLTAKLMSVLRTNVDCLSGPNTVCFVQPERLQHWVLMILGSTEESNRYKNLVRLLAAKLYAYNGDIDQALEELEKATVAAPEDHGYFLIQKAGLYRALGLNSEALEYLYQVKNDPKTKPIEIKIADEMLATLLP
ncbi:MAG: hypothetical protein DRQ52_12305 [Gammaproteobacteria bacterium]|nr:MAG: hypothetical protein DRQ52_12305 [Gammaproteobacteria bacterium]